MPPRGSRWSQSKPAETRTKSGANWRHHLAEGARGLPVPESARERQVARPTCARRPTHLLRSARARIVRVLVGRDVEHVRIALEEVLRAVAVMQVPVDDRHPPEALAP